MSETCKMVRYQCGTSRIVKWLNQMSETGNMVMYQCVALRISHMMGPPMGHPQQFSQQIFGYGQPPMNQGGSFQGGCFACGQFGHMAKDSFSSRGQNFSRGRRGSGGGRSFGGRFNHRGERKRGRN